METFVLRWTKDNLPFWQGVDDGEKIEINAVADVINKNAKLEAENEALRSYKNEVGAVCDVMFQFTMQRLHNPKEVEMKLNEHRNKLVETVQPYQDRIAQLKADNEWLRNSLDATRLHIQEMIDDEESFLADTKETNDD